jgi:hypothetical protein
MFLGKMSPMDVRKGQDGLVHWAPVTYGEPPSCWASRCSTHARPFTDSAVPEGTAVTCLWCITETFRE